MDIAHAMEQQVTLLRDSLRSCRRTVTEGAHTKRRCHIKKLISIDICD
jgi:hypothetical protein